MDKRLLRYTGGQPVRSQDIEFLQDALNGTVVNLAKAFGTTYILYGAVDEGRANVTDGAVVINGEVYKVPALGALGNKKLCYRYVDSDERTFYNGQKHKVVRTYEAYLSEDTGGAVAYIDLKTAKIPVAEINSRLDNMFVSDLSGWQNIELAERVTGKAEYIYPFWGNCILLRMNVSFKEYNGDGNSPYVSLFKKSIPHFFYAIPVSVTTISRGIAHSTIVGMGSNGALADSNGTLSLIENVFGYNLNIFTIIPISDE